MRQGVPELTCRSRVQLEKHPAIAMVGVVERGKGALSKVKEIRPNVVVVDLSGAGMGGFDTIYRLRNALPEIGIVAISSWNTQSCRSSAFESGADAFVSKTQLNKGLFKAVCYASRGNTRGGS